MPESKSKSKSKTKIKSRSKSKSKTRSKSKSKIVKILIDTDYLNDNIKMHMFFIDRQLMKQYEETLETRDNLFFYPSNNNQPLLERETTIIEINQYLQKNDMCGSGINVIYTNSHLKHDDILIVMKDISNEDTIVAFVTLDVSVITTHVNLICSNKEYKNGGTFLMKQLQTIAEEMNIKSIELDSVPESVGFYVKTGYVCKGRQGLCPMTRKIKTKVAKVEAHAPTNTFSKEEISDFISRCNSKDGDISQYLQKGIDPNTKTETEDGSPVLHLAIMNLNTNAVELLLKYHADINATDNWKMTPMMISINNTGIDEPSKLTKIKNIINMLIKANPDITLVNSYGDDVHHYVDDALAGAEDQDDTKLIKYLESLEELLS